MKLRLIINRVLWLNIIIFLLFSVSLSAKDSYWKKVDEGLHVGVFPASKKAVVGDSKIVVIRIDAKKYALKLLSASEYKHHNLTVKQWSEKYKLLGAINAGMYQKDYKSNVGFMKNFSHSNNSHVSKKYYSVAAFNPYDESKTEPFRIFDIDEFSMESLLKKYQSAVQNLRLIKRSRKNRWSVQEKSWSEAALGQDKAGNILFIFSRSPYSMFDFNNILLSLPIQLECAQHLEGGPEASLYFSHNSKKIELVGSYESGLYESDKNVFFLPLPNVLGIEKK